MNKIKLLFDATILSAIHQKCEGRGGIFFVAYNILKYLSKNEIFDITLYLEKSSYLNLIKKDSYLSTFKIVCANYVIKNQNNRNSDKYIKNTNFSAKDYDAYLNVEFISKLKDKCIPHFYVLHDTIPLIKPEIFTKEGRLTFFQNYNEIFDKNTNCFCVSNSCKQDFLRFFPILDEKRMIVTPIATSQNFSIQNDKEVLNKILKKYNLSAKNKYIFSFCSLIPRKNIPFTITSYLKFIEKNNITDLYFYLGGEGNKEKIFQELDKEVQNLFLKHKEKIVFLGYIDDNDVNLLYSNCEFFTYISLYEGFGMPPLEAMSSGAAVITSNVSSIPEVVSDAALTINPKDENACIEAMERFYYNKNAKNEYIQKGLIRAHEFSWDKTCKIIENTILNILKKENYELKG